MDGRHASLIADSVPKRQFADAQVSGADRVWANDITYGPTHESWLLIAIVLDLGSRWVVGRPMHPTLEQRIVLEALSMAREQRRLVKGPLHHADRGSRYVGRV